MTSKKQILVAIIVITTLIAIVAAGGFMSNFLKWQGDFEYVEIQLDTSLIAPTIVNDTYAIFNFTTESQMTEITAYDLVFIFYVTGMPVGFNITSINATLYGLYPNGTYAWYENVTWEELYLGAMSWSWRSLNHSIEPSQVQYFEMWIKTVFQGDPGTYEFKVFALEPEVPYFG